MLLRRGFRLGRRSGLRRRSCLGRRPRRSNLLAARLTALARRPRVKIAFIPPKTVRRRLSRWTRLGLRLLALRRLILWPLLLRRGPLLLLRR
jgi:hypothetical protein